MTFFQPNIGFFTPVSRIVTDAYNAEFYPYRVEINQEGQANSPTDKEIDEVHSVAIAVAAELDQKAVLEEFGICFKQRHRVKKILGQDGQFIVDKFFKIINTPYRLANAEEAYAKWKSFRRTSGRNILIPIFPACWGFACVRGCLG